VSEETIELLKFPCELPIKVMGRAEPGFEDLVKAIVRGFTPELPDSAVSSRASRNDRFLSVTVVFQASNRAQVDELYSTLGSAPEVSVVL
jgi:putative lipoic acid-binding regulatory protein